MVVQVSESVVIFREFRSRNCSVCAAMFNSSFFYKRDFIITLHDLWLEELEIRHKTTLAVKKPIL